MTLPAVWRAKGERKQASADARGGPGGRSAGRVGWIGRVHGRAGLAGGELGGDGLAEDDAAGRAGPGNGCGVWLWAASPSRWGAVLAGHVGGIEHVLYADGDALQGTGLNRGGRLAHLGGIEVREGPHAGIPIGDMVQIGFHQRLGSQLAVMDQSHRLGRGQAEQVRRHR